MAYQFQKQSKPTFTIEFQEPIVSMIMGGVELKTKSIEIKKIIDNPATKTVAIMTDKNQLYVLWSGDAYDAIGNWTNEQIEIRLREMVAAGVRK